MLQSDELQILNQLLDTIDEREAKILRLRFGLDGVEPLTLKEIADQVGCSRERVRQIVDESLTKLNQRINDDKPSQFFKKDPWAVERTDEQDTDRKLSRGAGRPIRSFSKTAF
jgi:RNA polymerase primary sigma factor